MKKSVNIALGIMMGNNCKYNFNLKMVPCIVQLKKERFLAAVKSIDLCVTVADLKRFVQRHCRNIVMDSPRQLGVKFA